MLKIGQLIQTQDVSTVGEAYRGLYGIIRSIDTNSHRYWIEFTPPPDPDPCKVIYVNGFDCHGGSWRDEHLSSIFGFCGQCEAKFDKIDYLCNTCRTEAR